MTFLIGVDLGQVSDFTATAVIERFAEGDEVASCQCRHLERYPLGTTYPDVVRQVRTLANARGTRALPTLALPRTPRPAP